MRMQGLLAAVLVTTAFATTTHAQDAGFKVPPGTKNIYITAPIYSELVMHTLPLDWNPMPAYHQDQGPMSMRTYLPKGQTLEDWKDLLTVQASYGWSKDWRNTPEYFLRGLGQLHRRLCGDQAVFEPLGETVVDGHPAYRAIVGCASHPSDPKMAEINYYIAVRGTNDLYLFQRGKRVPRFDPATPPLTADNVDALMTGIAPIGFCDWPAPKASECAKTRQ